MCAISLRYPACNAHAPYCHLWLVLLSNISTRYITDGKIFEREKANGPKKCSTLPSLQLLSETLLILNRIQQNIIAMCGRQLINIWSAFRILGLQINFDNFICVTCNLRRHNGNFTLLLRNSAYIVFLLLVRATCSTIFISELQM
jgi:hypothetical protein